MALKGKLIFCSQLMKIITTKVILSYMQPFFYYDFQNQNILGKIQNAFLNITKLLSNTFSSIQLLLLMGQKGIHRDTQTHKYFQTYTIMELKGIIYTHKNNHMHINQKAKKQSQVRIRIIQEFNQYQFLLDNFYKNS